MLYNKSTEITLIPMREDLPPWRIESTLARTQTAQRSVDCRVAFATRAPQDLHHAARKAHLGRVIDWPSLPPQGRRQAAQQRRRPPGRQSRSIRIVLFVFKIPGERRVQRCRDHGSLLETLPAGSSSSSSRSEQGRFPQTQATRHTTAVLCSSMTI